MALNSGTWPSHSTPLAHCRNWMAGGIHAETDGDDGVEVVELHVSGDLTAARRLNCSEIPKSCRLDDFLPGVKVGRSFRQPFRRWFGDRFVFRLAFRIPQLTVGTDVAGGGDWINLPVVAAEFLVKNKGGRRPAEVEQPVEGVLNVAGVATAGAQDALDDRRVFPDRLPIQRLQAGGDALDGVEEAGVARRVSSRPPVGMCLGTFLCFGGHGSQGLSRTKASPCASKLLKS